MEPKDYFKYQFPTLYNVMNGKITDFTNRSNSEYKPFISTYLKKSLVVLITDVTRCKLQTYYDHKVSTKDTSSKPLLELSQIGRWYANGFMSAYNYCEQYTKENSLIDTDLTSYIDELACTTEKKIESETKASKTNVLNLGRVEGARFFMIEREIEVSQEELGKTSLQNIPVQVTSMENFSGIALEKNLVHKECAQRIVSKIKEIVKNSKDKSIVGYCIICLKELGATKSSDKVLKEAFRNDFYPLVEKRIFDTSVNRILRSYRQKDKYSGADSGEKWGEKREIQYQEVRTSLLFAMSCKN